MNAPTRIATKFEPARTARAGARSGPSWELLPDEPIDPDRGGGSGRKLGRLALVACVCLGGALAVWGEPSRWREWLPEGAVEQMSALLSRTTARPEARPAASPQAEPAANRVAAEASSADEQPALELRADATLHPAEPSLGGKPNVLNKSSDAAARTSPPASAASIGTAYAAPDTGADPLARRASTAGLHPDISRVLLQRLSDADFKNAGAAIQKAVAETADDAVLVWPKQRKPELALFQVYFVPGAAPDCRRYVVTVTKDAWSTTALPMERCGVKPPRAKSG